MYGFVITQKGLELNAKLQAGEQLILTRAMVGDGVAPAGIDPGTLTDLISPFAKATSSEPTAVGASTMLVVEYRSDMNGGLDRDRYINEYGLFALDPDVGEILYFYASLGKYPEPVRAYDPGEPAVTRRYPISLTVADGVDVALGYLPSVYMLEPEVQAIIAAHNASPEAHADLREKVAAATQLSAETSALLGSAKTVNEALAAAVLPAGSILWYAKTTAPAGYLICDGSAVSRTDYARLFAAIGTAFGSGNGSTTFTLPDLRAKFVRGTGTSNGYTGTFGKTQEASHIRIIESALIAASLPSQAGSGDFDKTVSDTSGMHINNVNQGSRTKLNSYVRPYNIALTPIIKY